MLSSKWAYNPDRLNGKQGNNKNRASGPGGPVEYAGEDFGWDTAIYGTQYRKSPREANVDRARQAHTTLPAKQIKHASRRCRAQSTSSANTGPNCSLGGLHSIG